jgi:hypothetical protein
MDAAEQPVQERRPHECALLEPGLELEAQCLVTVDSEMRRLPFLADVVERARRIPMAR